MTYPIERRSNAGSWPVTSLPSIRIVPDVGSIIRLIIRSDVVLPQPEGPTSTVMAPVGMVMERLPTATVPSGYLLVTSSNSITAVLLLGSRAATVCGLPRVLERDLGETVSCQRSLCEWGYSTLLVR